MVPGNCWLGVGRPVSTVVSESLPGGGTEAGGWLCPKQVQLRTMSARTSGESNWRAMLNLTLPSTADPIQVTKGTLIPGVAFRHAASALFASTALRIWMHDFEDAIARGMKWAGKARGSTTKSLLVIWRRAWT